MSLTEFSQDRRKARKKCAVAGHPKREEIEAGIANGVPLEHIAAWTRTEEGAPSMVGMTLGRHKKRDCCCEP